jgi:fatty acid synthase subunit alpha
MIYSGWTDATTKDPLADWEVKAKFEKQILEHTGLRIIEPDAFWGYNPLDGGKFYHSVVITQELEPVEVADEETAHEFQKMHGESCDIFNKEGVWFVKMKTGSKIYIPKSMRRDRWVVGQIPTGWNAKLYGIPDDIINQVDRVTLFTLVSFVESLINAGVTDPYEFYKYIHVSKVGNCIGSGIGGMRALREMFLERKFGDAVDVQGDILQETFINTTAAWINMLLLSSSGPVKTPVGACATAMSHSQSQWTLS